MHRHALLSLILSGLLLYGGLFPFHGWTSGDAIAFLAEKQPVRSAYEDVFVNILVFIPLGIASTLALTLNARYRIARSVSLAIAHGFFLSFAIEAFQAFLPMRNSSAVDLLTNTLGTGIGSLLAVALRARANRLHAREHEWFEHSPATRLALTSFAVWALSQIVPLNPVIDVFTLRARWAALWRWPSATDPWSLGGLVAFALAVAGLGLLLKAVLRDSHRTHAWHFLALVIPVMARLVMGEHGLKFDALMGAAVGAMIACSFPPISRRNYGTLAALAIGASFILSEVLPGTGGAYRAFNWIPFKAHLQNPVVGVGALLEGMWIAIALVASRYVAKGGAEWRDVWVVSITSMVGAGALEVFQTRLPGRYPDVTIPLVMGAACLLSFLSSGVGRPRRRDAL